MNRSVNKPAFDTRRLIFATKRRRRRHWCRYLSSVVYSARKIL